MDAWPRSTRCRSDLRIVWDRLSAAPAIRPWRYWVRAAPWLRFLINPKAALLKFEAGDLAFAYEFGPGLFGDRPARATSRTARA